MPRHFAVVHTEDGDQLRRDALLGQPIDGRAGQVIPLHATSRIEREKDQVCVRRPAQPGSRLATVEGPEEIQIDTARNHDAGDQLPHLLRNNDDGIGKTRHEPAAQTFNATAEDITSVQRHDKRGMEAKPRGKRRQSIVSMHDVVWRRPRPSENIKSTFQIMQSRAEAENIDDVDRVAEPAQLLYLLEHEGSGARSLRTRVHVGDTENPHD